MCVYGHMLKKLESVCLKKIIFFLILIFITESMLAGI